MRLAMLILAIVTIPVFAYSATIEVPKDYTTIQAAIDASVNGDTVLVAPGTYIENIDFKGKAITVKSSGGAEVTVIDGGNPINPDYRSVVIFQNGESFDSVLDGFTLTNGHGTKKSINSSRGGGIYCYVAEPVIVNNIISGNMADDGGGICCASSSAIIMNNAIFENKAVMSYGGGICNIGGGAYGEIMNNTIYGNSANYGGGIYCYGQSHLHITNNTVCGNKANSGGGIFCMCEAVLIISNTILWDNSSSQGSNIFIKDVILDPLGYASRVYINNSNVKNGKNSVHVDPYGFLKWGQGIIDSDPLFVDEADMDFHLTFPSPCKDTGDNKFVTVLTDFEGDPRIASGPVDMGADEFYTHLYYTGDATPGKDISLNFIDAPTSSPVYLWVGFGVLDPPIHFKNYGEWYLQPPMLIDLFLGTIPQPSGVLSLPYKFDPSFPVMDIPMQALIGMKLTNLCVIPVK